MEIARHWRLKSQRYRLEGSTCPRCGQLSFPPRAVCSGCTALLARIENAALPVVLTSTGLTDIESHVRYKIMERMIR